MNPLCIVEPGFLYSFLAVCVAVPLQDHALQLHHDIVEERVFVELPQSLARSLLVVH